MYNIEYINSFWLIDDDSMITRIWGCKFLKVFKYGANSLNTKCEFNQLYVGIKTVLSFHREAHMYYSRSNIFLSVFIHKVLNRWQTNRLTRIAIIIANVDSIVFRVDELMTVNLRSSHCIPFPVLDNLGKTHFALNIKYKGETEESCDR